MNTFKFDPYFQWFEKTDHAVGVQRRVLLILDAIGKARHSDLHKTLHIVGNTNAIVQVTDAYHALKGRGLVQGSEFTYDELRFSNGEMWLTDEGRAEAQIIRIEWAQYRAWENDNGVTYPEPERVNTEFAEDYKQLAFYFHNLVSRYESLYFACWTRGERLIKLYLPEGQLVDVTGFPLDHEPTEDEAITAAGLFGPLGRIIYQDRIYPRSND
ncbi:hypothetical protein ABZ543_13340 [Streptomyces roseifaciens]